MIRPGAGVYLDRIRQEIPQHLSHPGGIRENLQLILQCHNFDDVAGVLSGRPMSLGRLVRDHSQIDLQASTASPVLSALATSSRSEMIASAVYGADDSRDERRLLRAGRLDTHLEQLSITLRRSEWVFNNRV